MEDLGLQFTNRNTMNSQSEAVPTVVPRDTLCTKCLKCIKDWLPVDFKKETILLVKLAGPVFMSQLLSILINFVSAVFCGHLGVTELVAVAYAIAVINVAGVSIGTGLAQVFDTLISQTYGSGNLKHVGVILQRGVLIEMLACFPCWAILMNFEHILLAVKQSPEVARLSQLYVKISMPALPAVFLYQLLERYLQNLGVIWPQVIFGVIANVVNAIINYILLYVLDMGVVGSAVANAISQITSVLTLYIYMLWMGLHKATWAGWSLDCLQEWGAFTKVAIPSMLMMCLEWWTFEIGGFLAGVISEVEWGAQSVAFQLIEIVLMLPFGVGIAASIQVGNALGAGNIKQAKESGKVSLICTFAVSCFVGIILGSSKNVIGYIFTTEKEIIERVADVMIILGFFHPLDAMMNVTGAIIRGAGKPSIGAICNLVGYYCIGIPIGAALMFAAKMGIVGLWLGLFVCVILQVAFFIIFLCKLNWRKAAEEAMVRAEVQVTEKKEVLAMENEGDAHIVRRESQIDITSSDVLSCEETPGAAVPRPLSVRQLVVRRGLTVLFMVLILAAGILTSQMLLKHK